MYQGTPYQQFHSATEGDTEWPSFHLGLDGVRFSELDQISVANVGNLEEASKVRVGGPGPFPRRRILVAGEMYFPTARATRALHPANLFLICKPICDLATQAMQCRKPDCAQLAG